MPAKHDSVIDTRADLPWLDQQDALQAIAARAESGELTEGQANKLADFHRDGFVNLGPLVSAEICRELRGEVTDFVDAHKHRLDTNWYEGLQNMYKTHDACRRATILPEVLEWCDLVLGRRALPFQTLSIPEGTQIPAHSDQILMSTRPAGFLIVAWLALEDIQPDAGPLKLWRGSHRLPYLQPQEIGVEPETSRAEATQMHNERYYKAIKQRLKDAESEPYVYLPKQGEVLLWHSNVIHEGTRRDHPSKTRHSLVVHYFGEGVETYSDLFSVPCVLPGLR